MTTTTITVIRAGAGSFPGTSRTHPKVLEKAAKMLRAEQGGIIADSLVTHCGGTLGLIMTHTRGAGSAEIRRLAKDVIRECTTVAGTMKLHIARNPPSLVIAEMEVLERETEPVLVFLSAGTGPGVWNHAMYRIFSDPITTAGLVTGPAIPPGYDFNVHDTAGKRKTTFRCPEEIQVMLSCIGDTSRFIIRTVRRRDGVIAASAGTTLPGTEPGHGPREDDSVMIVRCQDGLPPTGEALEPFCTPLLVNGPAGSMRYGPLMPVGVCDATMTRSGALPRCTCLGFQLNNGGLVGPADMFDDPAFDQVRSRCSRIADIFRAQGPFLTSRPLPGPNVDPSPPGPGEQFSRRWEPAPE